MKSEHINPFIQGAQNVLGMVCGGEAELGKLSVRKQPYMSEEVAIKIGVIGHIVGDVIFTMKASCACHIASKMMMGMPVPELDPMSTSAISELTNMISGNVATIFSGNEVLIDITPPQFLINPTAADFASIAADTGIVCVPLKFEGTHLFEIHIAFSA